MLCCVFCSSSSCVPYVASFSDWPFMIAPSVFSNVCCLLDLCPVYPMLPVSLIGHLWVPLRYSLTFFYFHLQWNVIFIIFQYCPRISVCSKFNHKQFVNQCIQSKASNDWVYNETRQCLKSEDKNRINYYVYCCPTQHDFHFRWWSCRIQ